MLSGLKSPRTGNAIGIDAGRLSIGGDSAGAALTIAACLMLRDAGEPGSIKLRWANGCAAPAFSHSPSCTPARRTAFSKRYRSLALPIVPLTRLPAGYRLVGFPRLRGSGFQLFHVRQVLRTPASALVGDQIVQ